MSKKCSKWNKKCSRLRIVLKVTKSLLHLFLVAFHSHVWPLATQYGHLMSCMAFIVSYGLLKQNIYLIGLESSFLVVINPNSFVLVIMTQSIEQYFVMVTVDIAKKVQESYSDPSLTEKVMLFSHQSSQLSQSQRDIKKTSNIWFSKWHFHNSGLLVKNRFDLNRGNNGSDLNLSKSNLNQGYEIIAVVLRLITQPTLQQHYSTVQNKTSGA